MSQNTLTADDYDPDDAIQQFNSEIRKKMKNGLSREQAIAAVAKRNPQLHKAFLLATNSSSRAKRLINEKYE